MRERKTSKTKQEFEAEPIDWKFLGLKRPYNMNYRNSKLLDPKSTNTQKVGVAFSQNLLDEIDRLSREYFPDGERTRSATIRLLLEVGLARVQEEEGRRAAHEKAVVQRDPQKRRDARIHTQEPERPGDWIE